MKRALVLTQYGQIAAAISGSLPKYDEAGSEIIYDYDTAVSNRVKMDLHGNNLNVLLKDDSGYGLSGIAAIAGTKKPETAGKVEIDNAGAMQIEVNGKGSTSALFAGNGGKLIIHNGGEKTEEKILKIRGRSKGKGQGIGINAETGIATAESGQGKQTELTIDGLVDVLADGKADQDGYLSHMGIGVGSSDLNIGGGEIKAVNGATVAIRAYSTMMAPVISITPLSAVRYPILATVRSPFWSFCSGVMALYQVAPSFIVSCMASFMLKPSQLVSFPVMDTFITPLP